MADPISTVIATVSEHPQAVATVASVYGVVRPFLAKLLGPAADEMGEIGRDYIKGRRAKNAERTLEEAEKMISEVGREPAEVPLKVLIPLLEAASLEEQGELTKKWAALLANATDSSGNRNRVDAGFIEILKQLSIHDARALQALFDFADKGNPLLKEEKPSERKMPPNGYGWSSQGYLINLRDKNIIEKLVPTSIANGGQPAQLCQTFDNLLRLRLLEKVENPPEKPNNYFQSSSDRYRPAFENVLFTALGVAFMYACLPPNK